jgi:hypothetical protein
MRRTSNPVLICALALLAIATGCSTSGNTESTVETAGTATQALGNPSTTLTISAPNPLSAIGPVLESANAIGIGPLVNVTSGSIAAMGAGGIATQPGDALNDVWSVGPVLLGSNTLVRGTLFAASVTQGLGDVVNARNTTPPITPPSTLTWTVSYPSGTANSFIVNPGPPLTLKPGLYGAITVNPLGTLNLSAGTYYLSGLAVNPTGTVKIDQTNGPVIIYVNGALLLDGPFVATGGGPPDLFVGYLGQLPIVLNGLPGCTAFNGALVAPFALLTLDAGTYAGFYSAQNIVVAGNAQISYQAPLAIAAAALAAGGTSGTGSISDAGILNAPDAGPFNAASLQTCTSLISPPTAALTGILAGAGDAGPGAAYQSAIARYCTAQGTSQCMQTLIGLANADYTAGALESVANTITPAQSIALDRDRYNKLHLAEADASVASSFCNGPDSDGDWIPDSVDKCPGTPPLTATDNSGCPLATLPPAPDASAFQTYWPMMKVMLDPLCNGAPSPGEVSGAAMWQTPNPQNGAGPQNGMFIVANAITNQPPGCHVWYLFQVRTMGPNGPAAPPFVVAWESAEAIPVVGNLPGLPNVPGQYLQFVANSSAGGGRALLASLAGSDFSVSFRVQAINGNGLRGPWGDWKSPTETDCLNLGVFCQQQ